MQQQVCNCGIRGEPLLSVPKDRAPSEEHHAKAQTYGEPKEVNPIAAASPSIFDSGSASCSVYLDTQEILLELEPLSH